MPSSERRDSRSSSRDSVDAQDGLGEDYFPLVTDDDLDELYDMLEPTALARLEATLQRLDTDSPAPPTPPTPPTPHNSSSTPFISGDSEIGFRYTFHYGDHSSLLNVNHASTNLPEGGYWQGVGGALEHAIVPKEEPASGSGMCVNAYRREIILDAKCVLEYSVGPHGRLQFVITSNGLNGVQASNHSSSGQKMRLPFGCSIEESRGADGLFQFTITPLLAKRFPTKSLFSSSASPNHTQGIFGGGASTGPPTQSAFGSSASPDPSRTQNIFGGGDYIGFSKSVFSTSRFFCDTTRAPHQKAPSTMDKQTFEYFKRHHVRLNCPSGFCCFAPHVTYETFMLSASHVTPNELPCKFQNLVSTIMDRETFEYLKSHHVFMGCTSSFCNFAADRTYEEFNPPSRPTILGAPSATLGKDHAASQQPIFARIGRLSCEGQSLVARMDRATFEYLKRHHVLMGCPDVSCEFAPDCTYEDSVRQKVSDKIDISVDCDRRTLVSNMDPATFEYLKRHHVRMGCGRSLCKFQPHRRYAERDATSEFERLQLGTPLYGEDGHFQVAYGPGRRLGNEDMEEDA